VGSLGTVHTKEACYDLCISMAAATAMVWTKPELLGNARQCYCKDGSSIIAAGQAWGAFLPVVNRGAPPYG
jgi:hypothetical protein